MDEFYRDVFGWRSATPQDVGRLAIFLDGTSPGRAWKGVHFGLLAAVVRTGASQLSCWFVREPLGESDGQSITVPSIHPICFVQFRPEPVATEKPVNDADQKASSVFDDCDCPLCQARRAAASRFTSLEQNQREFERRLGEKRAKLAKLLLAVATGTGPGTESERAKS